MSYFFENDQDYIPLSKPEESIPITQTIEQKININTEICKRNLFEILNENNISFFIPVYQRKYVWNEENIDVLFDDIENRISDNNDHFFGSIVIKKSLSNDNVYRIVDGQQRLITTILIMLVIKNIFSKLNDNCINELPTLINKNINNVFVRSNVFGIEDINNVFSNIWNGKIDYKLNQKSPLILKNYDYIKTKLENYKKDDLLIFIQTYLKKFQLSTIIFNNSDSIPNKSEMEIYQNINSKGTILELNELIKNYIFISCKEDIINEKEKEISEAYNRVFGEEKNLDDFFKSLILYHSSDCDDSENIISQNINENLKNFTNVIKDISKISDGNYNFEEFKLLMNRFEEYLDIYNSLNSSEGNISQTYIGQYINKYAKFALSLLWHDSKKRKLFVYLSYLIYELIIMNKIKDSSDNLNQIEKIFEYFTKMILKLSVIYNKNGNIIRKFVVRNIHILRNKYVNNNEKISFKIWLEM